MELCRCPLQAGAEQRPEGGQSLGKRLPNCTPPAGASWAILLKRRTRSCASAVWGVSKKKGDLSLRAYKETFCVTRGLTTLSLFPQLAHSGKRYCHRVDMRV